MQVSVEAGEGLVRKLVVEVPSETIDAEVENRLQSLKGRVRIDGFRPGKVPLKVIKQRYGRQVLFEVAGEMIQRTFQDALTQENLKPAGEPTIRDEVIKAGEPLQYTAEFEIFPEISVAPVSELKLVKTVASVSEEDVDNMLETLRKQQMDWQEVERASQDGDRVTIDFVGKTDGVAFDGGSADNVPVVIGSGSMIPGFEEQLTGKSKEEEFSFEVTFPDDYQAENLAGKPAEFSVKVVKVEEPALPELNDDFAARFGISEGGVDKLRADIRDNMERELALRIKTDLKADMMDKLLEANAIEVPEAMVRDEIETLKRSDRDSGAPARDEETYQQDAERRVKLGMLLGELVKIANLQPSMDMVDQRLQQMAKDYEDSAEFINHYKSNPQLMRGIETLVIEDMIVDWVAEQATVETVEKTFDEVMNPSAA